MTKKNTLLYLDESLVSSAKQHNLNLSEVAEAAIRSQLAPQLSQRELQLDFRQHLDDLKKQGQCYILPQMIKTIKIENIGPIEKLELNFAKGINIVIGRNATGKTALIKTLAYAFGVLSSPKPYYTLRHEAKTAEFSVEPYAEKIRMTCQRGKYETTILRENTCVLLDEPVLLLTKEDKRRFLAWVNKEFNQVIITSIDEEFSKFSNVKTFQLP